MYGIMFHVHEGDYLHLTVQSMPGLLKAVLIEYRDLKLLNYALKLYLFI